MQIVSEKIYFKETICSFIYPVIGIINSAIIRNQEIIFSINEDKLKTF